MFIPSKSSAKTSVGPSSLSTRIAIPPPFFSEWVDVWRSALKVEKLIVDGKRVSCLGLSQVSVKQIILYLADSNKNLRVDSLFTRLLTLQ